ncbi:hypothetical protein [Deinococcus sp. KNUC1210]|nr:hypothetical protein [Deinococcus sp. KNUC1210]
MLRNTQSERCSLQRQGRTAFIRVGGPATFQRPAGQSTAGRVG